MSWFLFVGLLTVSATFCARGEPLSESIAYSLLREAAAQSGSKIPSFFPTSDEEKLDHIHRATSHPVVETSSGIVTGSTLPESHAFYSIPYGKAPIGNLRFKPPEEFVSNEQINATVPDYVSCFEFYSRCESDDDCERNYAEDCLVLNVNVPSQVDLSSPPSELIPVMVWIHGGAFFAGSGTRPVYDARWLSYSTNTVIVNINYRLGPLGFLNYEDNGKTIDGNQGFFDQQLALMWVQKNIEKFGGDKNMVTLFGNSAGAQSVMLHLMSSTSDPMFKRAIMQSNPAAFYYPTKEEASLKTEALLQAINCTGSDFQCLREAPAFTLMNAHIPVMFSPRINFFNVVEPYRPILDDKEFTEQPLDFFKSGKWQSDKEVILGTMSEELGTLNDILQRLTVGEKLFQAFTLFIVGPDFADAVVERYKQLAPPNPPIRFDYTDILAQEVSDMVFVCPSRALARFMSSTASNSETPPIYLYVDSHPAGGSNCSAGDCGYASHGSENVFVFNSSLNTGYTFNEDDTAVSNLFSKFWGHFAHFGIPSDDPSIWPSYNLQPSEAGKINPWTNVRIQAPDSFIEDGYRQDLCDFWDSLNFYVDQTPSVIDTTPSAATTTQTAEKSTASVAGITTPLDEEAGMTTPDDACTFSSINVLAVAFCAAFVLEILKA